MEESSKTKTQIKELMGLVENFGEKRLLMYLYRTDKNFRAAEDDSFSARQAIETKLRAMLERKPLDKKVALKMWAETGYIDHDSGGIELVRKVERAHGIGGK